MKRQKEGEIRHEEQQRLAEAAAALATPPDETGIPDERLRLLFTCCHPALARETQVALTLRTLGGLATPEVAQAFLVPEPTMAKRLVRAKRKIREAAIPYRVPGPSEWSERLAPVLAVVYLVFNRGYSAGDDDARAALCDESIRLARILSELMPGEREVLGLRALVCLHDARRGARHDARGELVPVEEQDPSHWNGRRLREGLEALEQAASRGPRGPYRIQAEISAAHVEATLGGLAERERFARVEALYADLEASLPTPVVRINRAVALGRATSPGDGLRLLDAVADESTMRGRLDDYQPYHAARADLLRRAGRAVEARAAYDRAIELAEGEVERRFLARRRSSAT